MGTLETAPKNPHQLGSHIIRYQRNHYHKRNRYHDFER